MKNIHKKYLGLALLAILSFSAAFTSVKEKPTLFVIGDSTVKNGSGKGLNNMWGWGDFIADYFDKGKIKVENHALGGTSSRTFYTKGLWDSVLVKLKPGDFVMMQFGHNDGSPLDDTARARGTIKGIGTESKDIYNPITKKQETVYTYGWYLRKFINDAKKKGAIAIVCSAIPRSDWKDGKVLRLENGYAGWAQEVAKAEGVYFVDLNKLTADKYDLLGEEAVKAYFPGDHTHTNTEGARINAASVAEGIQLLKKCPLNQYMLKK
jgi:rhamnogalacturonan acetylesterase